MFEENERKKYLLKKYSCDSVLFLRQKVLMFTRIVLGGDYIKEI